MIVFPVEMGFVSFRILVTVNFIRYYLYLHSLHDILSLYFQVIATNDCNEAIP